LTMKVKEREKEMMEHIPETKLVDTIFALLKSSRQIPDYFSVAYERICSVLRDHRLSLYREQAHIVKVNSGEYIEMLEDIILRHYCYSLPEQEKELMGIGSSDEQEVLEYYGPVLGREKAVEIFGIGQAQIFVEGCRKVSFFNNQRFSDSGTDKYKLKCLLCNADGLYYEFMTFEKADEETGVGERKQDDTHPSYACLFFGCKDHYPYYAKDDEDRARQLIFRVGDELRRLNHIQ
jgi:hypothetical protein